MKGETIAVEFLRRAGLRIMARNYRFAKKEIDIIAQDGNTICFIEVKTRTSSEFGLPQESVTSKKIDNLTSLALSYIKRYSLGDYDFRFDVVCVFLDRNEKKAKVEYIKDAFSVDSRWSL